MFKVEPTQPHALFLAMAFGIMTVWVRADSPQDAKARAEAILNQLPYVISSEHFVIQKLEEVPPSVPQYQMCLDCLNGLGVGFYMKAIGWSEPDIDFDKIVKELSC